MYSTKQDLIDRFGPEELERYAWDVDNDQADEQRIARANLDAAELIDLYIGAVVPLPLTSAPDILISIACDIARYRLQDDNPLDAAKERYEAAVQRLKDIAQGKATLTLDGAPTEAGRTVYAHRSDDDRLFTRESLEDF
jgi:phage gp36-like protein